MQKVRNILSLVYKDKLEKICQGLNRICEFKYFVSYIVFSNGQVFALSNMFHMLAAYYFEKYYKEDYSFRRIVTDDRSYYLCDRTTSISKKFEEALERRFGIFRAYYIVRNSPECRFIFGVGKDSKFTDFENIYTSSVDKLEEFCCEFIDDMLEIIKLHNTTYRDSLILNDKHFRRNIIKNRSYEKNILTSRELNCIYWAAQGKTSEETALILSISKPTVDFYRNEIMRKLNAVNITQAVFEALKYGYLGSFHLTWSKMEATMINGIPLIESMDPSGDNMANNIWFSDSNSEITNSLIANL